MKQIITFFTLIFIVTSLQAQLNNVIVEKYYISDAHDATYVQYITDENTGDTLNTYIFEKGSITYRVYIQLEPGYKLTKVYGDANHTLKIASTENFFNQIENGKSLGKDIRSTDLKKNLVALDTWLTLGLAAKSKYGVLKTDDTDGSKVGGSTYNNDTLIANSNPAAGIPVTTSDGLADTVAAPKNWINYPFDNSGNDSTIFGNLTMKKQFISNNAFIQNSGVMGEGAGNNVLIAQLTTKGEISFEINVQLKNTLHPSDLPISFVAKNGADSIDANIKYSKYLSYPRSTVCGCKKTEFKEYSPDSDCSDSTLCKTKITFGCTDPQACNYNPDAMNIPSLCCYPGNCGNRDISLVCPNLGNSTKSKMILFPNPVNNQLSVEVTSGNNSETKIEVYNSYGRLVMVKNISIVNGTNIAPIDVSGLENGIYLVRFFNGDHDDRKTFIKTN